jgi:4-diphosphocytidyl-2-C-methyl-D-erythritol kinase
VVEVQVPSFAKINLDLRVLHKGADNYHEIRTIFQTVSLKDNLTIEFKRAKRTELILDSSIDIQDNLVLRAARIVLDHLKIHAWVRFKLDKKIPMGAGLGGGSSNAAAVLIALPALAGKPIDQSGLVRLAESIFMSPPRRPTGY